MMYVISEIVVALSALSLLSVLIGWVARGFVVQWELAEEDTGSDLERRLQEQMELNLQLRDDLDTARMRLRDLDGQLTAREPERQALEAELTRRGNQIKSLEKSVENGRAQLSLSNDALSRLRNELQNVQQQLRASEQAPASPLVPPAVAEPSRAVAFARAHDWAEAHEEDHEEAWIEPEPAPAGGAPATGELAGEGQVGAAPDSLDFEPIEALEAEFSEEVPFNAPARVQMQLPRHDSASSVGSLIEDLEAPGDAPEDMITAEVVIERQAPAAREVRLGRSSEVQVFDVVTDELSEEGELSELPTADVPAPPPMPAPNLGPAPRPGDLTRDQARQRVRSFVASLAGVVNGDVDDLQQIKGIGPKTKETLHDLGVTTFRHLAMLPEGEIDVMAKAIRYSSAKIRRGNWMEQARRLHQLKTGEQLA